MPSQTSAFSLNVPVAPVSVAPGGTIVLRGAYTSSAHAVVVDACQLGTAEGATSPGGLVNYEGGGWRLTDRNWTTHTCRLVATGQEGAVCRLAGMSSPCLPSQIDRIAHGLPSASTVSEFSASLVGGIQVEVLTPAEVAVQQPPAPPGWVARHAVGLGGGALALVAALVGARALARRGRTPESQVRRVAARVRRRLGASDPVYQRLAPTIDELCRQAGELSALRDRLRTKVTGTDRAALVRRRDELQARSAAREGAEAAALVDEQLKRVDRWRDESARAATRLDRVLEYLRALDARLDDALDTPDARTGVRVEEDARLLQDLERDVEAALEGAREADRLTARVGA